MQTIFMRSPDPLTSPVLWEDGVGVNIFIIAEAYFARFLRWCEGRHSRYQINGFRISLPVGLILAKAPLKRLHTVLG